MESSAPTSPVGIEAAHKGGSYWGSQTKPSPCFQNSRAERLPSQAVLSTITVHAAPAPRARRRAPLSQERSAMVAENGALWHPAVLKQPTANATRAATRGLMMPHRLPRFAPRLPPGLRGDRCASAPPQRTAERCSVAPRRSHRGPSLPASVHRTRCRLASLAAPVERLPAVCRVRCCRHSRCRALERRSARIGGPSRWARPQWWSHGCIAADET
jgi:hypothetical protein